MNNEQPDETGVAGADGARSWRARAVNWALMAGVFLAATVVTWALLHRPVGPLKRAAAVIAAPEPVPQPVSAEGVPVPLPSNLRFGRKGLVSLALDAQASDYDRGELEEVLAVVLKLSDGSARCVVTALALADPAHDPAPEALKAAGGAVSWTQARQRLVEQMHLEPEQAESVRGVLCRQAVRGAFDSNDSLSAARETLNRYGELIDSQAEAVLVMAAAMRLAAAGEEACGPIASLKPERPEVSARLAAAAGCTQ